MAVSGNFCGKVRVVDNALSCHEQESYSTTSHKESCMEFENQTDWNYYVDLRQTYLSLKLKFVKLEYQRLKKSTKKKQKRTKKRRRRKNKWLQLLALLIYTTTWNHCFPMLKCKSTISSYTTLMDCMRTNFTVPTTSRGHPWIHGTSTVREVRIWKIFQRKYGGTFVWTFLHKETENA